MTLKKGIFASSLLLASSQLLASNWIIINVGDINTVIPNPKVEQLIASATQSGTNLSVDLGNSANTEAYYYQRIEMVNGVAINHGWQCQEGTTVAANGNKLIDKTSFTGEYKYEVAACMTGNGCDVDAYESGQLVCSEPTSTALVSFSGDNPTGTVDTLPNSEFRNKHEHVGTVGGEFRVSESGAATYSIPISVPQGTAGVTPQLALSYSSQGGDGLLGRGWNISGTSSISRCPKTIAQDDIIGGVTGSTSDRLCYNGQRLTVKDGIANEASKTIAQLNSDYWNATKYVTEIDSFAIFHRIGDYAFVMETKSGEHHLFGDVNRISTSSVDSIGVKFRPNSFKVRDKYNSAVVNNTKDGEVTTGASNVGTSMSWMLKAIKDIKQNYIVFDYDSTQHYLREVHYTGNLAQNATPYAKIKFNYENNKKPTIGYRYGRISKLTQLLDSITVSIDQQIYRHYDLNYFTSNYAEEFNYLESVEECVDTAKTDCNKPLTFEWLKPAPISKTVGQSCEPDPGFEEFCFPTSSTDPFKAFTDTNSNAGQVHANLQVFDMDGDGYSDYVYTESGKWKIKRGPTFSTEKTLYNGLDDKAEYALNIDYNGDGVRDLLVANSKTSSWYVLTYDKNNTTRTRTVCRDSSRDEPDDCYESTYTSSVHTIPTSISAGYLEGYSSIADVDGDTLEDLIEIAGNTVTARLNSENGFIQGSSGLKTLLTLPSGQVIKAISKDREKKNANLISSAAIDFNGDGVTDLALNVDTYTGRCKGFSRDADGTEMWGWINSATTVAQCTAAASSSSGPHGYTSTQWVTSLQSNTWKFYFGNSTSSGVALNSTPAISLSGIKNPQFPDLNGDGLSDLFYQIGHKWYYRISTGTEFLAQKTTTFTTTDDNKHLFTVIDLNKDGRSDVMHPVDSGSSRYWNQFITVPNMLNAAEVKFVSRGTYPLEHKDTQIRFAEINGDGHLDLLQEKDNKWQKHLGTSVGQPRHVINKITNGFGVSTEIQYASLMTSDVYTSEVTPYADPTKYPDSLDNVKNHHIFSPKGGMYVVRAVSSDTGATTSTSVGYQYSGALINKLGRGNLGFYSLKTTDNATCDTSVSFERELDINGELIELGPVVTIDNCVTTETFYSQEYPYVGMPIRTVKKRGTDVFSESSNDLEFKTTADGAIHPYIKSSAETSHSFNDTFTTKYLLNHTFSEFTYDTYGNLTNSGVYVSNSSNPKTASNRHQTITTNDYTTSATNKRKGRLFTVDTEKKVYVGGVVKSDISRDSKFEYYAANSSAPMMLKKEIVSPDNNAFKTTKEYQYDEWGNKSKETLTSPAFIGSRYTETNYDDRGRYVFESVNHKGHKTEYTYNNKSSGTITGKVTESKVIDANGNSVKTQYDAWGAKIKTEGFDSHGVSFSGGIDAETITTYCKTGVACPSGAKYAVYSFTAGGADKAVYFDNFGREIQTKVQTLSGWSYTDTKYNSQGKPWKVSEPYFANQTKYWNETFYDKLRRTDYTKQAAGGITDISYQGLTTVTTDAAGQKKTSTKDYAGNLVKVKDHYNKELVYSYDAYGNLLTAKVNDKTQVTNTYNAYGKKRTTNDLDKGLWSYTYNALGQLKTQKTARTHETELFYDDLGRKKRRVDPEGTTCWYYDTYKDNKAKFSIGKLTEIRQYNSFRSSCPSLTATDHQYAEQYKYASNGKVQTRTVTFEGQQYASHTFYDEYSRVRNVVYPRLGMNVRNEYSKGYLHKVYNNASNDADFGKLLKHVSAVNARGHATTVTYANGAVENRDFWDETGLAYTFNVTGGNWHNHQTYTFNNVGTLTDRAMDVRSAAGTKSFNEHFGYDDLSRVKSRTLTGSAFSGFSMNESFTYDALGNLKTKTGISGNYVYDTSRPNRLTSVDGRVFKYDDNGNIEDDGERKHTYASFDKPTLIHNGSTEATATVKAAFSYGPSRQVLKKVDTINSKVTTTLYMGGYEQVAKDTGLIEHKFYVGNIVITRRNDNKNDTYFLHKDHLGSTIAISDMARREAKMFMYDTFGKQYQIYSNTGLYMPHNLGIDRGYTGHKMLNELGIIHMNGRIYDPTLGRFLQADPFIQAPENTQNYNRYSYVLNNPMSYTDPSGYIFKWLGKKIKKYWRPALAMVAAYYGYTYGMEWFSSTATISTTTTVSTTTAFGTVSSTSTVVTTASYATAGTYVGAGALSGALSGAVMTGSLRGATQGALTGAVLGGIGYYNQGSSRISRAISGGVNGALETGTVEGFARGAIAGQLDVDLGIKSYYSNQMVNFGVNRVSQYMRGYIVGGNESGMRSMRGGLVNDAVGHLVGLGGSYYRTGKFSTPKFRNGFYFYDVGGYGAISLGNVISGPSSLYYGNTPILEQHERKHFMEQSMLGQYYLPVQGIVAGLFKLTGGNVPPYFDCSPLITTTYDDLGVGGC